MRSILLVLALAAALPASATTSEFIVGLVSRHVESQTRGLGDAVEIEVTPLDARTRIADCPAPQAYTPRGVRLWGRARVGVRCTSPSPWLIHVPVHVKVSGHYLSMNSSSKAGQTLTDNDFRVVRGELTALPEDVLTRPEQARGQKLRTAVEAGHPLLAGHLQRPLLVRQGQTVRIVIRNPAFTVSSEGMALANGYPGDRVRVKNPAGKVIQGTATAEGIVDVSP